MEALGVYRAGARRHVEGRQNIKNWKGLFIEYKEHFDICVILFCRNVCVYATNITKDVIRD